MKSKSLYQYFLRYGLFWGVVFIPTLFASIYFGLIASDIYISESRFVVRSPERSSASPFEVLFKGAGFSNSQDDIYVVQNYIVSRDALINLDKNFDLRSSYGKGDIFVRFPGLDWDASFENMYRYYQKMVEVRFDSSSSIVTLKVRAFSAEEAQKINQQLLEMGEVLVNYLNERGRRDMIRFALQEVAQAEEKAKRAALALAQYRNQNGVIDPEKQSAIPLQQVAKLQDELVSAKSQLSQLYLAARDNPQIPVLKLRIHMLEDEINRELAKVAGSDRSFASKAAEFQRLALEKEFADKQLASAFASLEQARNEAQRQQLYLERIVQPSLPDAAMEPRRIRNILTTFVLGLVAWGVLTMILAGIKEHLD